MGFRKIDLSVNFREIRSCGCSEVTLEPPYRRRRDAVAVAVEWRGWSGDARALKRSENFEDGLADTLYVYLLMIVFYVI